MEADPGATLNRTALVTGASSGIGEAFALRLANDGYDLIIVARRGDRLESLATRIREHAGVAVLPIAADLTNARQLRELEVAAAGSETLDLLVNCAGVAGYMRFIDLAAEQAESLIDLHIIATTRLTRAVLPNMISRGHGTVINVSSGLAFSASLPAPPLPYRAVYASAKSYVNTFSEILSNELSGTGVQVQALCPGVVRTELHDVAGYDVSHVGTMLDPEEVVSASLAALLLNEVICVPTLEHLEPLVSLQSAREQILAGARAPAIASRYRGGRA
jgi:uncharacterized protein